MGKQKCGRSGGKPNTLASITTWDGVLVARVYELSSCGPELVAVRAGRPCYVETELSLLSVGEPPTDLVRRADG